ncbi:MAG: CvpA family protein [Spirochaetaceae bacterium]|jgi:membrane protein required for colicin V production|nr:CvpA family protein [Spirochaetaceae bacterium]
MTYAPLDIVLTILLLIIVLRAALNGFVEEALGMAWLILGLIFSISFYRQGAAFMRTKILADVKILPEVLSFVILFLIVFIVVKIITHILKDIVQKIRLGGLDHFLGALFGIFEGLLAAALILFVIDVQPLFDKNVVLKNSVYNRVLSDNVSSALETVKKRKDTDVGVPPSVPVDAPADAGGFGKE